MRIRLRQVALVARDLAAAEGEIRQELDLELCYRDPGVGLFGLTNALFPVGYKLLEVVSPHEDGTTAGRLLDKRGGDGGYMVILQVDDLDAMRARFGAAEARIVFEAVVDGITGLHLHPRDVGGAILSTDQADEWSAWPWAGPEWREHISTNVVDDITAVDIQAEDPTAMAQRWAEVLGCQAIDNTIALDEGKINFVAITDGRGDGVAAIEMRGTTGDSREIELVGCRLRIAG